MKEILKIREIAKNSKYPDAKDLHPDDWEDFRTIEDTEHSYDPEKNMVDHDMIVQRKSDGKYFKFTYTQYHYSGSNILEQTAHEVFQKTKTVTYYE